MKKITTTLLLLCSILYIYGQQDGCDNTRYFETIYENVIVTTDIQYGQNTTIGGSTIDLLMDIYEPKDDQLESRPVIVFAHGGGFVSGNKEGMAYICRDFAKKGFVTASISYRLFDADVSDPLVATEAFLMTIHDMKAAVRYFREDAATADLFKIDTDFIFAGGISAGAIMAGTIGYTDDSDDIASYIVDIMNGMGGLQGNSSTNTQYSSDVQGVLNFSGGIPESHYIDANDPPLFSFHDEFDDIVPCGYDPVIAPFHGSCDMHIAADEAGIKNEFYFNSDSDIHVGWYYGSAAYESARFLGEILCDVSAPEETSWEVVGSGLDNPGFAVGDISAVDENTIWTIPFWGTAFSRTTDGGQSWTTGTLPIDIDPTLEVTSIQAIDENTAWIIMSIHPSHTFGMIFKTTDGGMTWTDQTSSFFDSNESPRGFHFFNENDGFVLVRIWNGDAASSTHVCYVTSDGGANWEKLNSDAYPADFGEKLYYEDPNFLDVVGDHIWFGSSNGFVYHSTNKGHTWEKVFAMPFVAIASVAFKDEANGIIVGHNNTFGNTAYATSDGGATWTYLEMPPALRSRKIYFIPGAADESTCGTYMLYYGAGMPSGVAYSTDDGQSWTMVSEIPVHTVEFLSPEVGWMGSRIINAEERGLYKWKGGSLAGSNACVSGVEETIVENYNFTVYPNPVFEVVNLQLDNDWHGQLSLRVLNTLGQLLMVKNLEKPKGSTTWEIGTEGLSPGSYQLLLSDGKKTMVKPLVKF